MAVFRQIREIPLFAYDLIMADCAWLFRTWSEKGHAKSAQAHYTCTPTADLSKIPVGHFAKPDCVLWMWATNPMLPQAFEVMERWCFTFKTAGHWVKRGESGKLAFGPGYILRCAGEPFLIGTMGAPKTSNSVRSVVEGPRREHSRKPEEAFAAAEMLVPNAKRLDLFSRQERPGWDVFGDEVGKFEGRAA